MIEILKKDYQKRSDNFLLPLVLKEKQEGIKSFMYWDDYTIDDYKLIIQLEYEDIKLIENIKTITEVFDNGKILIVDISEWALDIEMLLSGKYSKMSNEAKKRICDYHSSKTGVIPLEIYIILYPKKEINLLQNMTPLEYVSYHYGIDKNSLEELGELGTKVIKEKETLILNLKQLEK